jgi:hypothetical protein
MSESSVNMEDLAAAAGLDIQDGSPFEETAPEQTEGETTMFDVNTETPLQSEAPAYQPEEVETEQSSLNNESDSGEDLDGMITNYLNERFGTNDLTLDYLQERLNTPQQQQAELDERVAKIAEFVENTGRSPEEWFQYQQLNPTEMDDLAAIKLQTMSEYPDLSADQVDKLVGSRYKLDEDLHDESDVELSKIQLQIDARKAKQSIDDLRSSYMLPQEQASTSDLFDDQWVDNMRSTVSDIDGISFDLPNGEEFTYGLDNTYKSDLINRNENLETYFDQYIDENGNWDVESLSIHRAVVDNMPAIAKALYQQGLSDGQRNLVGRAANAQMQTPGVGQGQEADPIAEQLKNALLGGNDSTMKFL